jgi:hypothetical protein
MNEAMFDLPDQAGFVDVTVTYLAATSPRGAGVVLLVERRPFPEGASLRHVATAHALDAMKRFHAYRVIAEREIEVAGQPALDIGARWCTEQDEAIYTRRIHLVVGATWMIFTGEAPFAEREFCDAYLDHVLASLQLRE